MKVELLRNEREKILRLRQELLAKPVLGVEHDPGFLYRYGIWLTALDTLLMMVEERGMSAGGALTRWLCTRKAWERRLCEEIANKRHDSDDCDEVDGIVKRWKKLDGLRIEIGFLEHLTHAMGGNNEKIHS